MSASTIVIPTLKKRSRASGLLQRLIGTFRYSPALVLGIGILLFFACLALLHPWLMPYDPIVGDPSSILEPPGSRYWMGTDGNGMDVLSRTIYGSIYAFAIAVPAVVLAMLIGVPIGLITGYVGGMTDEVLMRGFDALRAFPAMVLALAIVAATGPSIVNVIIIIALLDSPIFVRVVRAEVLSRRSGGFVEAAIAAGNPTWRVLFVHLLPNSLHGAFAQTAIRAAWAVRISATMAFLGIGIQQPTPEWGAMIRQGAEFMVTGQWWVAVFPGCALILMVLGLNLLGDGLQALMSRRQGKS